MVQRRILDISQTLVDAYIDLLYDHIYNRLKPKPLKCVVGIAKGGLYVSEALARRLHLPHYVLEVKTYNALNQPCEPYLGRIDPNIPSEGRLIVDDLVDTGITMKAIHKALGYANDKTAVLFYKLRSKPTPEFFASYKPPLWIKFHWEAPLLGDL